MLDFKDFLKENEESNETVYIKSSRLLKDLILNIESQVQKQIKEGNCEEFKYQYEQTKSNIEVSDDIFRNVIEMAYLGRNSLSSLIKNCMEYYSKTGKYLTKFKYDGINELTVIVSERTRGEYDPEDQSIIIEISFPYFIDILKNKGIIPNNVKELFEYMLDHELTHYFEHENNPESLYKGLNVVGGDLFKDDDRFKPEEKLEYNQYKLSRNEINANHVSSASVIAKMIARGDLDINNNKEIVAKYKDVFSRGDGVNFEDYPKKDQERVLKRLFIDVINPELEYRKIYNENF